MKKVYVWYVTYQIGASSEAAKFCDSTFGGAVKQASEHLPQVVEDFGGKPADVVGVQRGSEIIQPAKRRK